MFASKLDIRLVVSVATVLYYMCKSIKMNVHVENLKIKKQSVHWFWLTEPNKTMGIMCGRNSSET